MGKMSRLNIEQTNKMVDFLQQIAQYIDEEVMPHIELLPAQSRLIDLQEMIEDYKERIKGE